MNSITARHTGTWLMLVIAAISTDTCRGDLFALLTGNNGIVRMDSTTGAVIDTYSGFDPFFPVPVLTNAGLAFDGRRLYVNRRMDPATEEIWSFDLASETWQPLGFLDTFSIDPSGPHQLSGLGYTPGMFGEGSLISVSRRISDIRPSYLVEYSLFPPFGIFSPMFPVGVLPTDIDALGVDFDPATGEIWIAAEEVDGTTRTPILLRTDQAGNVLATVSPALGPVVIPRGLAFDNGNLFVAARNLPAIANEVHEIDRGTGAVLNTFLIPGGGTVAALAGGTVIPEPSTGLLGALVLGLLASCSRRQA